MITITTVRIDGINYYVYTDLQHGTIVPWFTPLLLALTFGIGLFARRGLNQNEVPYLGFICRSHLATIYPADQRVYMENNRVHARKYNTLISVA